MKIHDAEGCAPTMSSMCVAGFSELLPALVDFPTYELWRVLSIHWWCSLWGSVWEVHAQVQVQYTETIFLKPTLLALIHLTSSKWESALVLVHRSPVRQSGRLLLPLMNLIHIWRRHTGMWKISIFLLVNGRSLQSQSSKQIQLQIGKKKTFALHLPPVWSIRGLINMMAEHILM